MQQEREVPEVQAVVAAARPHRLRPVQVQEEPAAPVVLVAAERPSPIQAPRMPVVLVAPVAPVAPVALLLPALALVLVVLAVVAAAVLGSRTRAPARPRLLSFPRLKAKAAVENRILVLPLVPRSLPETNPQPHLVP